MAQTTLQFPIEIDFQKSMLSNNAARRTSIGMAHGMKIHKKNEFDHVVQNLKQKKSKRSVLAIDHNVAQRP